MADLSARLLELAQQGLPLVSRPYLALAEQLGTTEETVIDTLADLQEQGLIRELSAFFDPKRMGYRSTLACMTVPAERVDEVTAILDDLPEVTHNYLREHQFNMWFAVIAPSEEEIARLLAEIEQRTGCGPIHNLPAEKMFKIRVAFKAGDMSA